jgi:hypothetical protein
LASRTRNQSSKKQGVKKIPNKTPKPQPPQPPNKNVVAQPVPLAALDIRKPLKIFFSQYSKFQYQPGRSSVLEFYRLCKEYGWKRDSPKKETARDDFDRAMKKEFNSLYGSDEKDINNWYKLCHILSIDPLPNTTKKCRAVSP